MYVPKILHNKVIKMVSPLPLSSGTRRRKHSSEYFKASMRAERNGMEWSIKCTTVVLRDFTDVKSLIANAVQILVQAASLKVQVQNAGANSKCLQMLHFC